MMHRKAIVTVVFSTIGFLLIITALFANELGLDRSEGWGRVRIITLVCGAGFALGAIAYYRHAEKIILLFDRVKSYLENLPLISKIVKNPGLNRALRLCDDYRFVTPFIALVILAHIWFISAGTWTTWISPTRYYADLARGFQRGNLHLPTRPDPKLFDLPNPYDPATRWQVEAPLDITYYNGRYYLYWGPVPALVLLALSPFTHGRVGDLFLVFGFVSGIFAAQVLFMISMWERFFRTLPRWMLVVSILLVGLSNPITFMLNNFNSARIYEAAITGGQFFLMSGLLAAVTFSGEGPSSWRLILAGSLWVLAIGTRLTLAVPVAFLSLMLAWWIMKSSNWSGRGILKLLMLGFPLALGLAGLGWYNWARFGSFTETGYYFQLAGVPLQQYYDILFHPSYILQNIYNYLLHPFDLQPQFPFIYPTYGNTEAIFPSYPPLGIYSAQLITGIFWTVPFVVFAAIPLGLVISNLFRRKTIQDDVAIKRTTSLNWITLNLSGSFLLAFGMLLFFFWAGMRYAEDFMPSLTVLSAIGFWQGYELLAPTVIGKKLYAAAGIILVIASIFISTLEAIAINDARFELIRLFTAR